MELGKSNGTILVVDDDGDVRMLVKDLLEFEGYAVLTAGDAETAMRVHEDCQSVVALLLTDVIMPNINGLELADRLLHKQHLSIASTYHVALHLRYQIQPASFRWHRRI